MYIGKTFSVVQYATLPQYDQYEESVINPVILDAALQSVFLIGRSAVTKTDDIMLPFCMRNMKLLQKPVPEGYVVSLIKSKSAESNSYAIFLTDMSGRILTEIDDYIIKRVHGIVSKETHNNND